MFHLGKAVTLDEINVNIASRQPDFQLCFQGIGNPLTLKDDGMADASAMNQGDIRLTKLDFRKTVTTWLHGQCQAWYKEVDNRNKKGDVTAPTDAGRYAPLSPPTSSSALLHFAGDAVLFAPKDVDATLRWKSAGEGPSDAHNYIALSHRIHKIYVCTSSMTAEAADAVVTQMSVAKSSFEGDLNFEIIPNALPDWYCTEALEAQKKKKKEIPANAEAISNYARLADSIQTKERLRDILTKFAPSPRRATVTAHVSCKYARIAEALQAYSRGKVAEIPHCRRTLRTSSHLLGSATPLVISNNCSDKLGRS